MAGILLIVLLLADPIVQVYNGIMTTKQLNESQKKIEDRLSNIEKSLSNIDSNTTETPTMNSLEKVGF